MCLFHPTVTDLNHWNWAGDRIIFDSIVPASRRPIGRTTGKAYDIDVREFLVSENNAITKRVLTQAMPAFLEAQGIHADAFTRRGPGAFDLRAHLIASYVAATVRYAPSDGHDPWQFPAETLALRSGDCEDIAFLLASLLLASGISGYNVRVALGQVHVRGARGRRQRYDHMWVMYKCEAGHWLLLEPLHLDAHRAPTTVRKPVPAAPATPPVPIGPTAYRPQFLFNGDHLWEVEGTGETRSFRETLKRSWSRLHPRFAGQVHQTILQTALAGVAPPYVRDALDRHFSRIGGIGPVIDDIDNVVTRGYDCRDHFDNAFIDAGWQQVQARLAAFNASNMDLDKFAYAAHGIADFYAHTSYLHFARITGDAAQPYDPAQPGAGLQRTPDYAAGSDLDLVSGAFSTNPAVYPGSAADAAATWHGRLISGRYAQKGDAHDLPEWLTSIPKSLRGTPDFAARGALPHHNEIAVDDEQPSAAHTLYRTRPGPGIPDRLVYAQQFAWRKQTAILHIRQAFVQNWHGGALR